MDVLCQVDHLDPAAIGVAVAVGRAAAVPVKVGNADGTAIDHLTIALQHTALGIRIGRVVDRIRTGKDLLIQMLLVCVPQLILIPTRQIQMQLHV